MNKIRSIIKLTWVLVLIPSVMYIVYGKSLLIGNDEVSIAQTKSINVLWQDASRWDSTTAREVAKINPDKFIINIDGPTSASTPETGPHPLQLKGFIDTLVNIYKWKGILVMHPDCSIGDFGPDWNNKDIKWTSTSWQRYADYLILLNDTLEAHKLPVFTEILIETADSYMTSKAIVQNTIFNNFRAYIDKKDPTNNIKLSATSDWQTNWTNWKAVDYYYAQMYDMCYPQSKGGIPELCGTNFPKEPNRVKTLVKNMVQGIKLDSLNKVSFIFTYAPNTKCPSTNAPMFGEPNAYWTEVQFTAFADSFKNSMSNASVGIWHSESPIKNW